MQVTWDDVDIEKSEVLDVQWNQNIYFVSKKAFKYINFLRRCRKYFIASDLLTITTLISDRRWNTILMYRPKPRIQKRAKGIQLYRPIGKPSQCCLCFLILSLLQWLVYRRIEKPCSCFYTLHASFSHCISIYRWLTSRADYALLEEFILQPYYSYVERIIG